MYLEALRKLYQLATSKGMKLDLQNMRRLSARFGSPEQKFATVHVAGTNGKGSVTTKIAAVLQLCGLKVGLYTSPHLSSFRERIRINGRCISEEEVAAGVEALFSQETSATFFEATTQLAFNYFAAQQVDVAVLETGLGGRLDATNIVTPLLSVITSIALDHTEILGATREAIAAEKAGIIKPGVPVVIGPQANLPPIVERAHILQAPLIKCGGDFADYLQENRAIAHTALMQLKSHFAISEAALAEGLEALPPCRFERVADRLVLDVAHNPDGIAHCLALARQTFPNQPLHIVAGFSRGKDVQRSLQLLSAAAVQVHLVSTDHPRLLPVSEITLSAPNLIAAATLEQGLQQAQASGGVVLVLGSCFLMSEVRRLVGIVEPRDPVVLFDCLTNTAFLRH